MHNPMMSVLRDVYRPSLSDFSLESVHRDIQGNMKRSGEIFHLRTYRTTDKARYRSGLMRIPRMFASGTFESISSDSPKEHSLLLALYCPSREKPAVVRNQLGAVPHTALAFIDVDDLGVWGFIRIETATTLKTHARACDLTAGMIRKKYRIDAVSENAKELNTPVLMSHDPDAIINLHASPFDWHKRKSDQILNHLAQLGPDETIGPKELASALDMTYGAVRNRLHILLKAGKIDCPTRGQYKRVSVVS